MKFYRLAEAPLHTNDVVFRQSAIKAAVPFLLMLAIGGGALYAAIRFQTWVAGLVGSFFGLMAFFFGLAFRRALGPQNWLLRVHPGGLLVKFRSYLNAHFPVDRPIVFELESEDIEWARVTRLNRRVPGNKGPQTESVTALDLKLRDPDLSELERLLREERQLKISTRFEDEPVRVLPDGLVRVRLRCLGTAGITPSPKQALAALTGLLRVRTLPEEKQFIDLASDPGDARAREDKILELAASGNKHAAIRLTREFYNYSLAEARQFVEELMGKKE